jgi:short subunit dehydrogenase
MANVLNEKVAIVTGGGSGIGEGLCRELARRGARVVVADINSAEAGRVAASITGIGGQAAVSTVDVSRAEEVTRLVEETATGYGRLSRLRPVQRLPERGGGRDDPARRHTPGTGGRRAGQDDGSSPGGPGDPGRRGPQQGADRLPGGHPLGPTP